MKTLKFWNGRPYGVLGHGDEFKSAHVYVAAYSAADARRVCVEAGKDDPGAREISVYWAPCWGTLMKDVQPERGLWVVHGYHGKPQRIQPAQADERARKEKL